MWHFFREVQVSFIIASWNGEKIYRIPSQDSPNLIRMIAIDREVESMSLVSGSLASTLLASEDSLWIQNGPASERIRTIDATGLLLEN